MKLAITLFCCAAALGGPADTREVSGVSVPATATIAHKELTLNGAGVRKKMVFFKVYVVALYLEQPTSDARTAITSDQEKLIVFRMLRAVSRKQFVEALEKGFVRNSSGVMTILRERLDLLQKALHPLEKGDVLTFTYLPGSGTVLRGQGQEMTIPGKDFADALLSGWLGPSPVNGDLKRQLLG
ncbi:MAG: chalcone isomerase family protein, partial [Immundisolibacter sp.]|uniref:chalcone isomerase family protein n=1 Tax=Immundisolibacter sp. TaxID=1934948 RepID=UPI003EE162C5